MGYFSHCPFITEEIIERFFLSLEEHAEYLFQTETAFSEKSNWGVIENHGLYCIAKAMQWHPKSGQWSQTAIWRLEKCLATQVFHDGVHWEQSFMYHNEVLKCYLEVLRVADLAHEILPETFYEITKKMAYFNLFAKKPNHCQIAAGDSDETDLRDVITASGIQFLDGKLKYQGYEYPDFESIWDYGKKKGESYIDLEKIPVSYGIKEFKDSGNYFYRSGWGEDSDFLHFKCGPLGGGHGHFDKLHIDLAINGEDVLIDSGRYTYVDSKIRHGLKSAIAHNTILIDEKEYTESIDSWGVKNLTIPIRQETISRDGFFCMQGGHLGYIKNGIFLNRKVIAIHSKIYIIADCCYGTGVHKCTQLYHFNPNGAVYRDENSAYFKGKNGMTMLYPVGKEVKVSFEESEVSNRYNQKSTGQVIKMEKTVNFPSALCTVIIGDWKTEKEYRVEKVDVRAKLTNRVLEDREAEGIRIYSKDCDYLIVISHAETGRDCDYIGNFDSYGLGRIMISDLKAGQGSMKVLEW